MARPKNSKAPQDFAFAENLKRLLQGRKISDVAREANISASTLHDWVVGRRSTNYEGLGRLAKVLGVDLEVLLLGSPPTKRIELDSIVGPGFTVQSEPSLSGMFLIELKRVVPKK